jgi:hypothetical protein
MVFWLGIVSLELGWIEGDCGGIITSLVFG